MKTFIEHFEENARLNPDSIAIKSVGKPKGITYGKLDLWSGKIYAYLKEQGIGKEDFVQICLPRGARAIIAMIGVWKAGAAFALVENTYAPERIDFIRQDCGCKLVIDEEMFVEMMQVKALEGHEETDPHDAAYAVYTSGTTGKPKGVIHEYGNLNEAVATLCYDGVPFGPPDCRMAMIAPMNFVACTIIIIAVLDGCGTLYIVPYAVVKDLKALQEFLLAEKITATFMTASMIRIYKDPSPYLEAIFISSEPANGVYLEGPKLFNLHAMSETGFATTVYRLDKSYDAAPIGKPQDGRNIYILDEQGQPVAEGETGEFCFDNPYVRGYINLPEKNKEAFVNGVFHSGDMAKKLPDGNFVLLGRNDDMVKINGNRIEPGEIEAAVKELLGLEFAVAKGFDIGGRAFVCAYYLNGEAAAKGLAKADGKLNKTVSEMNEQLLERLPYYMLPTYYIGLDAPPINANGKLDRKSLKAPELNDFREEYVAPTNEVEEKICAAFAKALKQERIGINDDFYLIGGDSLASIEVITECNMPGLTINDLFKGRTPAVIAAEYQRLHGNETDADKANEAAMTMELPLNNEQLFVMDYNFYNPLSTMWNLTQMFKLKKYVDIAKFAAAINKAMRNHPAFSTKIIINEDGDFVQVYDEDIFKPVEIVDISEEELEELKPDLVRVIKPTYGPLYRSTIYRTKEANYFFLDVHHLISDGISLGILRSDILKCYLEPDCQLKPDYYYLVRKHDAEYKTTENYREANEYYLNFTSEKWIWNFPPDHEEIKIEGGEFSKGMGITGEDLESNPQIKALGLNGFFTAVTAITKAIMLGENRAVVEWLHSGRDDAAKANMFGLVYRTKAAFLDFAKLDTVGKIYSEMKEQANRGMAYSNFDYLTLGEETVPSFLYQRNIFSLGDFGQLVDEFIELESQEDASECTFEIEVLDNGDELTFLINYAGNQYDDDTVNKFYNLFCDIVEKLRDAD